MSGLAPLIACSIAFLLRIVSSNAMVNVAVVNALIIYFVLLTLRRTELALEEEHRHASALVSML